MAKKQLFGYRFQGLLEERRGGDNARRQWAPAMDARIGGQEREKEQCLDFGQLNDFNKGCIEAARDRWLTASGHCFFAYHEGRRV